MSQSFVCQYDLLPGLKEARPSISIQSDAIWQSHKCNGAWKGLKKVNWSSSTHFESNKCQISAYLPSIVGHLSNYYCYLQICIIYRYTWSYNYMYDSQISKIIWKSDLLTQWSTKVTEWMDMLLNQKITKIMKNQNKMEAGYLQFWAQYKFEFVGKYIAIKC